MVDPSPTERAAKMAQDLTKLIRSRLAMERGDLDFGTGVTEDGALEVRSGGKGIAVAIQVAVAERGGVTATKVVVYDSPDGDDRNNPRVLVNQAGQLTLKQVETEIIPKLLDSL